MKTISQAKSFAGMQGVYSHPSESCRCDMTFAVYVPPQAATAPVPVLWYLSGLTCTHANVMEKGEYRRLAAKLGLMIVCPDTSPRGDGIPDEPGNWQFGKGAGFYLDATEAPYAKNYRMASYIADELPRLIAEHFPADMDRQAIFGHSMGGHGALTLALNNPGRFKSVSAFAPIVNPMEADWSVGAFEKYLGPDRETWRAYDACALVEAGKSCPHILVDQGSADGFITTGLMPERFEAVCAAGGQQLTLRMQDGYDHSYNFISTFMDDHLHWHTERLA